MARIRTIKPEFWENEDISKMPYGCRLLFIGMWNFADDQGVIKDNATLLKSKIFPYDENLRVSEIKKWIESLQNAQMLIPISHNGESYLIICTFTKHQLLDKRYQKFIIPNDLIVKRLAEHGVTTTCSHSDHAGLTPQEEEKEKEEEKESIPPIAPPAGGDERRADGIDDESQPSEQDDPPTPPDPTKPPPTWKESFEIYQDDLRLAYRAAAADKQWINKRQKFHPNLDILLSLEKACADFWSTEEGWYHKLKEHRRKGPESWINWRNTFNSTLTLKPNQVFKPRNPQQQDERPEKY